MTAAGPTSRCSWCAASGVRALPSSAFELAAGACVAVRGPSGAGKTLLLRALADLDPSQGEVTLDGAAARRDAGAALAAPRDLSRGRARLVGR